MEQSINMINFHLQGFQLILITLQFFEFLLFFALLLNSLLLIENFLVIFEKLVKFPVCVNERLISSLFYFFVNNV